MTETNAIESAGNDFILSSYPHKVTVGNLKSSLARNDEAAKKHIIEFIYHRLNQRYLTPLLHIPKEFKSGFLMMASACLLIETLQLFYTGQNETKRREGEKAFAFFAREIDFFPGFAADSSNFYRNIRCGILHQAETKGSYRIVRTGSMFDARHKTINATKFVKSLECCLDNYIHNLHMSKKTLPLGKTHS